MRKIFGKFTSDNRGITLVEIIVAVSVFSFLALAITSLFLTSWRYNSIVWEQLKTQNEGRKATQDFVNELRTASQSSIGAYPIEAAATTSITFYSNIDTDTLRERIRYFMSNRTLKRGVIKPTGNPLTYNSLNEVVTDVAHDVANTTTPVFYYYDSNFSGAEAALTYPIDVTQIRVIKITLQLDENPNLTPTPFFIESKGLLRNLKDN